jgi:hypothetical protein
MQKLSMTNQIRVTESCLVLWDAIEKDPTCRFDHIDDFILEATKCVRGVDADCAEADSAHFIEWDDVLPLTLSGRLIYSHGKYADNHKFSLAFIQDLGDKATTIIILDQWEHPKGD